jgi:Ca2+-binding RTX toxin-like protein
MKFLSHPDAGAKALRSSGPDAGATVTGTNSDDILDGFDFDPATGLHSDDLLLGFGGNDYLYGYNGNDTLIGGKGRDYMIGGNGDDTYVLRAGDGVKNPLGAGVREEIGEGFDTIRIEGIAAADLRIWSDGGGYAFSIGGHNGRPGVEFVTTGMLSSGSSDFWRRYEAIEFDDGTVWTAATGLQLIGSNLGQFTEGTDLGDLIDGRNGDDYLYGYAGNDTLIGGKGNDYMAGGDGDDTYILRVGDGRAFAAGGGIREEIGAGYDTIRIEGIAAQDMRIWSDGGSYAFSLGRGGVEFVTTGMLSSGSSDFWRRYEAIEFDDGTVWTAATGLRLIGSNLGQFTEGTDLGDLIDGRNGDDYLYGYAGNDTLIGGKGEDYMAGGDGDDTYILRVGHGTTFGGANGIREEIGEGYDTIRIRGVAADDLRMWSDGTGYALSLGGTGGTPDLEFVKTSILIDGSSDFWRRIEAVKFDDGTVWTAATGLRIIGTNQGQFGEGTDLGDFIDGRGGDDYLHGHDGNDTISGGTGMDYITGGQGQDVFVYSAGMGLDRVADFIQGHDRIDLSGFAGASDFASLAPFIGGTFDTVLTFSASDSFVLFGVDPTALSAGDFLF